MKRLLIMAAAGLMLASCGKKEDEPYRFRTDEYVWLNVEGIHTQKTALQNPKGVRSEVHRTDWTMHEIVRSEKVYIYCDARTEQWTRWFWDELRDTVNDRLMMRGEDILMVDGTIMPDFIRHENFYITIGGYEGRGDHTDFDTIGYIPNKVIRAAERKIDSLYALEKYDEIYELFHTAFTMRQCTGAEYKALVAAGEN